MPLHKDEGIVLFKRAYGESDKIVRLFTLGSGKVAAIAKGANKSQKRFMNTLEPFNHISLEYFEKYGKGMVRIENAHTIRQSRVIHIGYPDPDIWDDKLHDARGVSSIRSYLCQEKRTVSHAYPGGRSCTPLFIALRHTPDQYRADSPEGCSDTIFRLFRLPFRKDVSQVL